MPIDYVRVISCTYHFLRSTPAPASASMPMCLALMRSYVSVFLVTCNVSIYTRAHVEKPDFTGNGKKMQVPKLKTKES